MNPDVEVMVMIQRISEDNVADVIRGSDLIQDDEIYMTANMRFFIHCLQDMTG